MLIGKDKYKTFCEKVLAKKKLPKAILLCGDSKIGKNFAAKWLLKKYTCVENSLNCSCSICKQIDTNEYAHFNEYSPVQNSFGVDVIRDVIKTSKESSVPHFFLLNHVEFLNTHSANALLKVLENPLDNTVIFMTADNIKNVPETIASRCIHFNLTYANKEEALKFITNTLQVKSNLPNLRAATSIGKIKNAYTQTATVQSEKKEYIEFIKNVTAVSLRESLKHTAFFEDRSEYKISRWIEIWSGRVVKKGADVYEGGDIYLFSKHILKLLKLNHNKKVVIPFFIAGIHKLMRCNTIEKKKFVEKWLGEWRV
jgi:DNA polymerase III delta prime subunit